MRDSPVVRRPAHSCRKTGGTDRPRGVVLTAAVVVLVAATGPLAAQGSNVAAPFGTVGAWSGRSNAS